MTYLEWLDSLKPGDAVIVTRYEDERGTVIRITPSRRFIVQIESRTYSVEFNNDGIERGNKSSLRSMRLTQPTPDVLERIERRELIAAIGRINASSWSIDKLRRVMAAMTEPDEA